MLVNSLDQAEKLKGPAWSPAVWPDGAARKKETVSCLSCLALDYDKSRDGNPGLTDEEQDLVHEWVETTKWLYATHTSYTSGFYAPRRKFRLVLFTNRDMTPSEYQSLWDVIAEKSPVAPDPTRRAFSSIYFLPRVPAAHKEHYQAWWGGDSLIDVDKLLARRLKLNDALLGGGVERDWKHELRTTSEKHSTLVRAAFRFGLDAFGEGLQRDAVGETVWAACKVELEANTTADPVRDWAAAEKTAKSQALLGWDRAKSEAGEVADAVKSFSPGEKTLAVAQKALRRELKLLLLNPKNYLAGAAYRLGRYTPHVLKTDEVVRELFKNATQFVASGADGFLEETEVRATIDTNIARGQKLPLYVYTGWKEDLLLDEEGKIRACDENAVLFFEHHPEVEGLLKFNVRRNKACLEYAPPWRTNQTEFPAPIQDHDACDAGRWLARQLGKPLASSERTLKALLATAAKRPYDPFRDWLESLKWDGNPRLDSWLSKAAHVEENLFHRLVGRLFLLQAVARTLQPGCVAQYVLVLVGKQGLGKSSLFRELAGEEFYCSNIGDIRKEEASFNLEKYVIVELAELAAFKRSEMEEIKRFISDANEDLRRKYARVSETVTRRAVFGGTTNEQNFLQDTENRRFWPVRCEKLVDLVWLKENREQLWAEAHARVTGGENWWPTREEEAAQMSPRQDEFLDTDALFEDLEFFEKPFTKWPNECPQMETFQDQLDVGTKMFRWVAVSQVHILLGTDVKNRADQIRVKKMCLQRKWEPEIIRSGKKTLRSFKIR